jgi:hypothetical protein
MYALGLIMTIKRAIAGRMNYPVDKGPPGRSDCRWRISVRARTSAAVIDDLINHTGSLFSEEEVVDMFKYLLYLWTSVIAVIAE